VDLVEGTADLRAVDLVEVAGAAVHGGGNGLVGGLENWLIGFFGLFFVFYSINQGGHLQGTHLS
jgi:hypothetical protein